MRRRGFVYSKKRYRLFMSTFTPTYAVPVIALLIGVLAAVIIVSRTPKETIRGLGDAIMLSGSDESLLLTYWKCSRYHIIAALLSTSFLGVFAVPVILGYRGFTMCCTSAALILDYNFKGAIISAIILGLPSLISLPCLIIIAADSMKASAELFYLRLGLRQGLSTRCAPRRIFVCLGILLPVAFFDNQMVPGLISYVFN